MSHTRPNRESAIGRTVALGVVGLLVAGGAFAQLSFTDVAASVGVQFHQESELAVPIGGGSAWADLNNDGWEDLYIPQATGCNKLFRNVGDGSFTDILQAAGAEDCTGTSHGAAIADYDNDGDQDIYVTNHGQNRLFKNMFVENGTPSFEDVTVAAGMDNDGAHNSASAAWGDYDGDGLLDLAVVNHTLYVPIDDTSCGEDLVYHNEGDGTFTEVGHELGVALSGDNGDPGCGLAVTWSDYDNDGDVDLMIINDFGPLNNHNKLFRNDGVDGFSDESGRSIFDYPMFGMGIGIGDINRDGFFEYYMANIGPNKLALNIGDGTFSELAAFAGVLATDRGTYGGAAGLVSWGGVFVDMNNDGHEELFVSNGGAPHDKWPNMFGSDYEDLNPVYAYANLGRLKFVEGHTPGGLTEEGYFRSIVASDFDRDGDVDLHVGNLQGNNVLYLNETTKAGNWLQVKAIGSTSNRDAIGARIIVTSPGGRQYREVSGGSSFLGRNSLVAHFGIGGAPAVNSVEVIFPSGVSVVETNVAANQRIEILEP